MVTAINKAVRLWLRPVLLVVLMLSLPATAAHVLIYRWIDPVDGNVHFSEHQPEGSDFDIVSVRPQQEPVPAPEVQKRISAMEVETSRYLQEQRKKLLQRRQLATENAEKSLTCTRAKSWLRKLRSRPASRLLIVQRGESARRMTAEEHQTRIEETKRLISKQCKEA